MALTTTATATAAAAATIARATAGQISAENGTTVTKLRQTPPANTPANDFLWTSAREPHALRRRLILQAHPEIKALMGKPCATLRFVVAALVALQLALAATVAAVPALPLWAFCLLTYAVSGTVNHALMLAIHEISHNLAFKSRLANRVLALVANLPIGIPCATTFRRYHLEHHKYQGEDGVDVDIPLWVEAWLFRSTVGKLVWCFLQPLFYSLRPVLLNPKTPGWWEAANVLTIAVFDVAVYACLGPRALIYLVAGSLLGMGLHPVAGHFIAEHYVHGPDQETYSYYGVLNWLTFNVGYHNEHHDFPSIPGSRLPQVKKLAPEFYDQLPYYKSWTLVILDFIFNTDMSCFCRVKRSLLTREDKIELKRLAES